MLDARPLVGTVQPMARAVINVAVTEQARPRGVRQEASAGTVRLLWPGGCHRKYVAAGSLGLVASLAALAGLALWPDYPVPGLILPVAMAALSSGVLLIGLFQQVVITLSTNVLAAQRGLLPFFVPIIFPLWGGRRIPTVEIYRVWLEPGVGRHSQDAEAPEQDLCVMTIGGGRQVLLARLPLEQGRYFVQELNTFLGLDGQDRQQDRSWTRASFA